MFDAYLISSRKLHAIYGIRPPAWQPPHILLSPHHAHHHNTTPPTPPPIPIVREALHSSNLLAIWDYNKLTNSLALVQQSIHLADGILLSQQNNWSTLRPTHSLLLPHHIRSHTAGLTCHSTVMSHTAGLTHSSLKTTYTYIYYVKIKNKLVQWTYGADLSHRGCQLGIQMLERISVWKWIPYRFKKQNYKTHYQFHFVQSWLEVS